MENCPISNQPCNYPKNISYTILKNETTNSVDICQNCSGFCQIKDVLFTSCKKCGMLLLDIQNSLKIGCDNCYIQFKFIIEKNITKCQVDNKHCGKIPNCLQNMNIDQIQRLMESAIATENYEFAQKCKETISQKANSAFVVDQ